jgi:hypothetical protein
LVAAMPDEPPPITAAAGSLVLMREHGSKR